MKKPLKQYEVLERASLFLAKHDREQAVAPLLLQHYLQVSRERFYAQMREDVPETAMHDFWTAIEEHAARGVPLEHITGKASFYSRNFAVSPDVLIPRFETEELVEGVLDFVREGDARKNGNIVDIGTGSGVIAITLALELPHAHVYATDISSAALEVAQKNAKAHEADVTFYQGDLLNPIDEKVIQPDVIVTNPPYVAEEDITELSDTVRHFDPKLALFAADHGMAFYKRFFQQLRTRRARPHLVAFEIGHTQGEAVKQLAQEMFPKSTVQVKKDMNGKKRMVFVEM